MQQIFKTTILLAILTGLFMTIGYVVGGQSGAIMAFGIAAVMNFGMFWFSDKIVLKMQGARPLKDHEHPEIVQMVRELTEKDRLPMPKLYIMDTPMPNAFATGRSHKHAVVAVTTGIMEMLNKDELKAVLGHELGHVKNRDMLVSTIAATIAGAIGFMAEIAIWTGGLFGGGDEEEGPGAFIGTIAMIIIAPIAAMLIQMAVSRSREFLADQHGKKLVGSGEDLANALRKLENFKHKVGPIQPSPTQEATAHLMFTNPFSMSGLASLFSTHPSTDQRVKRLTGR
jgi:heat shock protein HtpX